MAKSSDETVLNSELALAEYLRDIAKLWRQHRYLIVSHRTGKQVTLTQRRALHLFCEMLADQLNASGLDQRKVLKPRVAIPWSKETVKEYLWKPLQEATIGVESTNDAMRHEYGRVYDVLAQHMATEFNLCIPDWPKKKKEDD